MHGMAHGRRDVARRPRGRLKQGAELGKLGCDRLGLRLCNLKAALDGDRASLDNALRRPLDGDPFFYSSNGAAITSDPSVVVHDRIALQRAAVLLRSQSCAARTTKLAAGGLVDIQTTIAARRQMSSSALHAAGHLCRHRDRDRLRLRDRGSRAFVDASAHQRRWRRRARVGSS